MVGRDISAYLSCRDLPDVVAPKDTLLEKYEAIAWTQRAVVSQEPLPGIFSEMGNFGQPTASEVVEKISLFLIYRV
jgi:hypothetical protein